MRFSAIADRWWVNNHNLYWLESSSYIYNFIYRPICAITQKPTIVTQFILWFKKQYQCQLLFGQRMFWYTNVYLILTRACFVYKSTKRLFIRWLFIIWNIKTVLLWKGLHHFFLAPDFRVAFYFSVLQQLYLYPVFASFEYCMLFS